MTILLAVLLGFCVDLILGDPRWMPHPVVYMGKAITRLERLLRRLLPDTPRALFWGGVVLAAVLPLGTLAFSAGVIWLAGRIHPALGFAVQVLWCWQALAVKDLRVETMHVYEPLCKGDLLAARKAVSRVVGRDTQSLTSEGVTKAAVETIAENFSDGIIAPMLYLLIGGAPLGLAYKAINTMDSMVGYKNDKYLVLRPGRRKTGRRGRIHPRPAVCFVLDCRGLLHRKQCGERLAYLAAGPAQACQPQRCPAGIRLRGCAGGPAGRSGLVFRQAA